MSATIYYIPAKAARDTTRDQLLEHGTALLAQGWTDEAPTSWIDQLVAWESEALSGG